MKTKALVYTNTNILDQLNWEKEIANQKPLYGDPEELRAEDGQEHGRKIRIRSVESILIIVGNFNVVISFIIRIFVLFNHSQTLKS